MEETNNAGTLGGDPANQTEGYHHKPVQFETFRHPVRNGDWICEKCGFHNFGRRIDCHKCKTPCNPEARMALDIEPDHDFRLKMGDVPRNQSGRTFKKMAHLNAPHRMTKNGAVKSESEDDDIKKMGEKDMAWELNKQRIMELQKKLEMITLSEPNLEEALLRKRKTIKKLLTTHPACINMAGAPPQSEIDYVLFERRIPGIQQQWDQEKAMERRRVERRSRAQFARRTAIEQEDQEILKHSRILQGHARGDDSD
eukprot:gene5793-341_t